MSKQHDLFGAIPTASPPTLAGLETAPEAISPALEREVISRIDAAPLEPFKFGQWRGKRLTANYGSGYDYQRGALTPAEALPPWLLDLRAALAPLFARRAEDFVQALVIRYDPGAGIGWHRDRPQYGEVIGLSLGASAVLRLRQRSGGNFARARLPLEPRAAYLLSGPARSVWEHSIAPMEDTRWSVTLRSLA